ncbi:MAG TPA: hypothetical protein DEP84_10970 [Chloroflexi bacterium]|nr:hypothetical protein [Chloroflexota bacterium]
MTSVARALAVVGQGEEARRILPRTFLMAVVAARENVLQVLRAGAALIAAIDRGETLWRVGQGVIAVEGWLGFGSSAV